MASLLLLEGLLPPECSPSVQGYRPQGKVPICAWLPTLGERFQSVQGHLPLECFHGLAQEALQVEHLLHQEALDGRLLPAGWVDALGRRPPHTDLMFEL